MRYALATFLVFTFIATNGFAGTKSGSGEEPVQVSSEPVDNIVVVLDASGSMERGLGNQSRMQAAKSALWDVLTKAPQNMHVGILVFPGKRWVYPLGPRNDQDLRAAIDRIQEGGGTPLGKHIKIGADALLKKRDKSFGYGTYRLLVVTDGEANNDDVPLVKKYTPDVMSRGITVDVIGVGMSKKHTLATKVHAYRSANDPESLRIAVSETFAEVGDDAVQDDGEDPFEIIAHLPDDSATAFITALATSGNHPIGTKPPKAKLNSSGSSGKTGGSEEKSGGGCSCEVAEGPGSSGIFLMLFVGLLLFAKRRKTGGSHEPRNKV